VILAVPMSERLADSGVTKSKRRLPYRGIHNLAEKLHGKAQSNFDVTKNTQEAMEKIHKEKRCQNQYVLE